MCPRYLSARPLGHYRFRSAPGNHRYYAQLVGRFTLSHWSSLAGWLAGKGRVVVALGNACHVLVQLEWELPGGGPGPNMPRFQCLESEPMLTECASRGSSWRPLYQ